MGTLFLLADGAVSAQACPVTGALRLDAAARVTPTDWVASLVPFTASTGAPLRYALIAAPAAPVTLGPLPVAGGAVALRHGDHVFIGAREMIFSTDAVPAPVAAAPDAVCPVCAEALDGTDRRALHACPRCALRACNVCWTLAPRGVCLQPGCEQPAALGRQPWQPEPEDFVTWEDVS